MSERRQAFRREPIEIDLGDRVISVAPVPWQVRNDFGDEVIRQHVEILNGAVRLYIDPETQAPQLEAKLSEKISDPMALLALGLSEEEFEKVKNEILYDNQITEILLAICDVNKLDQLRPMLDPNLTTPTALSGTLLDLMASGEENILKTESSDDSSSQESTETSSEPSPTQN